MKRLVANVLGLAMLTAVFCAPAWTGSGSSDAQAKDSKKSSAAPSKNSDKLILNPTDIPTRIWANMPAGMAPRAAVLAIHGLGLHKDTYRKMAEDLNARGIIVYAIDVRGFGEWIKRNPNNRVNYPQTFQDIKVTLEKMHRDHPNVPIFISGESMGGAIALQATAQFQDLIDGMFSSVPAGDRVHNTRMSLKIALHAITGGFGKLMPIDNVIDYGTSIPEFHKEWSTDPMGRNTMTPSELLRFDDLCDDNFKMAKKITKAPCLIIQGGYDGLIVPEATAKLADMFPPENPNRIIAYSTNSEHLILEYGRYRIHEGYPDLKYVTDWLDQRIAEWNKKAGSVVDATVKITAPGQSAKLSYWIELLRDGKMYRVNNKMEFKTGDEIRFHMTPNIDGYVTVLMKGSSGAFAQLFPGQQTGTDNRLAAGQDCKVPYNSYLKFDSTPGTETLSVIFSQRKEAPNLALYRPSSSTAYVSPSADGSKDIVPTRMKLSWDDADSGPMAPELVASTVINPNRPGGVVSVTSEDSTLAVNIALEHK